MRIATHELTPRGHVLEGNTRIDAGRRVRSAGGWASPARLAAGEKFAAYVAHELRAPIALQRALVEVTLTDPHADTDALRAMGEGVVAACEWQERLLEALLTLSRSECGRLRRERVDVAATAAHVLRAQDRNGLRCTPALETARTSGDPQLVERLVANLVANAVGHNVPGGRFEVVTYTAAGRAVLSVANTGLPIPTGELQRLFQPFQRLSSNPRTFSDGVGLGLAIVLAIADAHDAAVTAQARSGGGLEIDVAFPALD